MRDLDVRTALRAGELALHQGQPNTLIVEELGLHHGEVRVDVAVVNGEIHGYEIKSAKDSLVRLPDQARAYSAALDRVTLVIAECHLARAMGIIPEWWRVQIAEETTAGIVFSNVREGRRNPSIDPIALLELLWKEEAITILDELGAARGWRSKRLSLIYGRLAELLTVEELGKRVRQALKSRQKWRPDAIRT